MTGRMVHKLPGFILLLSSSADMPRCREWGNIEVIQVVVSLVCHARLNVGCWALVGNSDLTGCKESRKTL